RNGSRPGAASARQAIAKIARNQGRRGHRRLDLRRASRASDVRNFRGPESGQGEGNLRRPRRQHRRDAQASDLTSVAKAFMPGASRFVSTSLVPGRMMVETAMRTIISSLAAASALILLAATATSQSPPASKKWTPPRTIYGQP